MNIKFLADAFGVWSGWAYLYRGQIPQDAQPPAHITIQLAHLLEDINFISSVIEINGHYYVYVKTPLPLHQDFHEVGNLQPEYKENTLEDINQGDQ